jgi:hypothetical protein
VIGGFAPRSPAPFRGQVDEVRLFSMALTVEEIRAYRDAMAASDRHGDK